MFESYRPQYTFFKGMSNLKVKKVAIKKELVMRNTDVKYKRVFAIHLKVMARGIVLADKQTDQPKSI